MATPQRSPFLTPTTHTTPNTLATLHLRRDLSIPVILSGPASSDDDPRSTNDVTTRIRASEQGYAEGAVTNTRFGSFPHSTMIGIPWGTQVRASVVDTGSRGRIGEGKGQGRDGDRGGGKKRKREPAVVKVEGVGGGGGTSSENGVGAGGEDNHDDAHGPSRSEAVTKTRAPILAPTGFLHILAPTPERWTTSLPHRTQIVYTPDYSYILHRLRVRPGSVVIEAGSGSGSFTHAAARSVFSGYRDGGHGVKVVDEGAGGRGDVEGDDDVTRGEEEGNAMGTGSAANGNEVFHEGGENTDTTTRNEGNGEKRQPAADQPSKPRGHVYTYEFHAERQRKLEVEISEHGLTDIVTSLHRDVYRNGFLLDPIDTSCAVSTEQQAKVPEDVGTTGEAPPQPQASISMAASPKANAIFLDLPAPWTALPHLRRLPTHLSPSPLDPESSVHLCCFMPCIEQVTRTVATLRREGWVDVEMVEMMHKRIDVRREYTGYEYDGMRGVNGGVAGSVDEAVRKLRDVEGAARRYREMQKRNAAAAGMEQGEDEEEEEEKVENDVDSVKPTETSRQTDRKLVEENLYKSGQLTHRSEPELKTHTSYLVFAILPREWMEEDELKARQSLRGVLEQKRNLPKSQRTLKKEAKRRKKVNGMKDEEKDVAADVMMDED